MIRKAELVRYDKLADSGKNKPLRVVVETSDNDQHEAVLKPIGWNHLTQSTVAVELVAAAVGAMVGMPICEPFLVQEPSALLNTIVDPEVRSGLQTCDWPAFASKHAGRQWRIWSTGDEISDTELRAALSVLFFDAVSGNADRGGNTPNLLIKGTKIKAIDHEHCFAEYLLFLPPPPPWEPNGMQWLWTISKKNILLLALAESENLDFEHIRLAWSGLQDADLEAIVSLLPSDWRDATVAVNWAIQRIKDVRDNIAPCIKEFERVLTQ